MTRFNKLSRSKSSKSGKRTSRAPGFLGQNRPNLAGGPQGLLAFSGIVFLIKHFTIPIQIHRRLILVSFGEKSFSRYNKHTFKGYKQTWFLISNIKKFQETCKTATSVPSACQMVTTTHIACHSLTTRCAILQENLQHSFWDGFLQHTTPISCIPQEQSFKKLVRLSQVIHKLVTTVPTLLITFNNGSDIAHHLNNGSDIAHHLSSTHNLL